MSRTLGQVKKIVTALEVLACNIVEYFYELCCTYFDKPVRQCPPKVSY